MKKLLFLLPALLLLAGCGKQPTFEVVMPVTEVLTATVAEVPVEPAVIIPTTGSVTVTFEAQPTQLPGNYTDNGAMLRAWAEKNIKTLDIPMDIKNARIGFKLAKLSKNENIPGNIQIWDGMKKLCNGRLSTMKATIDTDTDTYRYDLNVVTIQNSYNGYMIDVVDLTSAIGQKLTIKAWIGESNNYIESITINYDL